MQLPSFHDDYVVGYQVHCESRCIVLQIKQAQTQQIRNVTFTEVAGYCLVNDALGNIVSALEQVSAATIITEHAAQIAESYRVSGAPGPWAADINTAGWQLAAQGVHGFQLSSSFGISGWVLAKQVTVALAPKDAALSAW